MPPIRYRVSGKEERRNEDTLSKYSPSRAVLMHSLCCLISVRRAFKFGLAIAFLFS